MNIYIPTRGRADQITTGTLAHIPTSMWNQVYVVVHSDELDDYRRALNFGPHILDFEYGGISDKRQRIAEHAGATAARQFIMLDDDLELFVRRSPDSWQLREATGDEVVTMFQRISKDLNRYAQVAISAREGNNRRGVGDHSALIKENERCMRITAFRTDLYLSCELGRIQFMEDMDVTLQLLKRGFKNAVYFWYANKQRMSNSPGGCSLYRTVKSHNASADELAAFHPGLVRVRLKRNRVDREGFGTRKEVKVLWKKAYRQGTES